MAYALTHRSYTGQAGLYAYIQDKERLLYWDNVGSAWLVTLTDNCKIAFTESSEKGVYTASAANLTPVKGGTYNISVFPSTGTDYLISTDEMVPPLTETLLQVVNGVQRAVRFPVSSALTDSFSLGVIQKINDILTTILPTEGRMEHLKVSGSFVTVAAQSLYRITPINCTGVTELLYLRVPNADFLKGPVNDVDFKAIKDVNNQDFGEETVPTIFRIASFSGGFPVIEVFPTPTAGGVISFEVVKKPVKLSVATEYVISPDLVRIGATMLSKMELGRDAKAEELMFNRALGLHSSSETNFDIGEEAEV
jgi:hypothetical protein